MLLPFGRLGDFISRKKTNGLGLVFFTIGALIGVSGINTFSLILARSVQGIGVAMIMGTGLGALK